MNFKVTSWNPETQREDTETQPMTLNRARKACEGFTRNNPGIDYRVVELSSTPWEL